MKTLLRNVRSVFIVFALVLTVCYSQSRYVYAAMSPLDTSGQWVRNEDFDEDNYKSYTLTLVQDSKVKVNMICYQRIDFDFMKTDYNVIINDFGYGSRSTPDTIEMEEYLSAGTYYIRLKNSADTRSDAYDIKTSIEGVMNTAENEPNSAYAQANLLALNTDYTGVLGCEDDTDWFRFDIPASGQYTFKTMGYGDMYYYMYNEDLTNTILNEPKSGSFQKPETLTKDLEMSKGIYYFQVKSCHYRGSGKYIFSLKEKGYQSSPQESPQQATTAAPVQSVPNNNNAMSRAKNFKVNKRQYWTVGGNNPADWFKIVVPYKGRIQVDFHSANDGLTKLILCKSNGKVINYAASKNVVILSAGTYFVGVTRTGTKVNYNFKLFYTPVMSGPRITRTSSSRKSVTVKFANVKGVTGYQISIATNKKFKKAWHIMTTATTRKITGLKRNRKYFVKVRAYKKYQNRYYYGDFSKVRTVYTTR